MLKRVSMLAALLVLVLVVVIVLTQRKPAMNRNATAIRPSESRIKQLEAIGYLDWSEGDASLDESGVMVWNRDLAYPGYTLIASRLRREAYLIDMDGQVVHTWVHASDPPDTEAWEGATMRPNGDLLVLLKFTKVLNLSWNSDLIWSLDIPAHHDIAKTSNGN